MKLPPLAQRTDNCFLILQYNCISNSRTLNSQFMELVLKVSEVSWVSWWSFISTVGWTGAPYWLRRFTILSLRAGGRWDRRHGIAVRSSATSMRGTSRHHRRYIVILDNQIRHQFETCWISAGCFLNWRHLILIQQRHNTIQRWDIYIYIYIYIYIIYIYIYTQKILYCFACKAPPNLIYATKILTVVFDCD